MSQGTSRSNRLPVAVPSYDSENPRAEREKSEANLMYSMLLWEVYMVGLRLLPQNLPSRGDVSKPPFLITEYQKPRISGKCILPETT